MVVWDKGTVGQEKFCTGTKGQRDKETFFVPGQRDIRTSRIVFCRQNSQQRHLQIIRGGMKQTNVIII